MMPFRFLVPLSLVFAAAGFAGVYFPGNARTQAAAQALASSDPANDPAQCESCKHTPSNRFSMLAAGGTAPVKALKSLSDLVSEARSSESSSAGARWKVMEVMGSMNAGELERLIEGALDLSTLFKSQSFEFEFAVRRLVELEPQKAADLWAKNASLRPKADLFLNRWVKKDPEAFAAWSLSQPRELQQASASALGAFAKDAPEKFASVAAQFGQSPAGPSGASSAIAGMLEREAGAPEKGFAYAQTLPEGPLRDAALMEMLKWPGANAYANPAVASALAQADPEVARRLGRELSKNAGELPVGPARESAFTAALREQSGADPAAAAKRLESLAGSVDYAPAVRGFVEATVRKDPATALEWALSIDPSASLQRSSALERAASAWFKADAAAARAWAETAPLSDAEYFQLTGRARAR
ncbi:MAG: hypothetical protein DVB28_001943 [Verrucomicrobia bacterium]|nr:MAG: hypothetical protein DVB28_001943 [Verrucomicrobiota bacterium]